jgi:dipeptidyl-peptidase-4
MISNSATTFNRRATAAFAVPLVLFIFLTPSRGEEKKKNDYTDPSTCHYESMEVAGWTLHVNKRLLGERSDIGDKALQVLRIQLGQISLFMPERPLADLRKVPIWVDDRPSGAAQYHPGRKWLVDNGYNPDKVKAVDVSQAGAFTRYVTDQPFVMMHELAHAYHDRVLGFEDPRIIEAYNNAVAEKKYESVLLISGKSVRHYALTNHKEYFAECTEAYFGTNDFYPFVRAELKQHDPTVYALLDEIWRDIPRDKKPEDAPNVASPKPDVAP